VTPRRLKLSLLLGSLVASGLVFLGWTQEWFSVAIVDGPLLSVQGDVAAPAVSTLALTCLVLIGALSIAGPFFRPVLGVLEILLGIAVVFSGVLALTDPIAASASAISDATGIAGATSLPSLVASLAVSAWPWVSTIGGGLISLLGLTVILTSRQWPASTRKYSAVRVEPVEGRTAVDDWDSLSDGTDPTSR
jgi:hypothetical protein